MHPHQLKHAESENHNPEISKSRIVPQNVPQNVPHWGTNLEWGTKWGTNLIGRELSPVPFKHLNTPEKFESVQYYFGRRRAHYGCEV